MAKHKTKKTNVFIPTVINIPIYCSKLLVLFDISDLPEAAKIIRTHTAELNDEEAKELITKLTTTTGYSVNISDSSNRQLYIISAYGTDDLADRMNTLVHELSHTCLQICKFITYNPLVQQEPFSYLMGFLMEECVKEYLRRKNY